MKGSVACIAAFFLAILTAGCAYRGSTLIDARVDLAQYSTWSWLPRRDARVAVSHGEAAALDTQLSQLIERRLGEKGWRRVALEPDFYLTYQLALVEQQIVVHEPRAIFELSSLHSSPSYLIESSRKVSQRYVDTRLGIVALRAGGEVLWSGTFSQNEQRNHAVKLEEAVARLIERFPHRD